MEPDELYTDVVMEMLSAYMLTPEDSHDDLIDSVMDSVKSNPNFPQEGLMQGMVFGGIVHLTLMLTYMAKTLGVPRDDILRHYAIVYKNVRHYVAQIPEVHPDVVSELARKMYEE